MGVVKVLFWALLVGAGVVAGFYVATGEVPNQANSADIFDDPSYEGVNGERIEWIEIRDDGIYVGTNMDGFGPMGLDVYVTLPSGERHKMFEERRDDIDNAIVYSYENDSLEGGNYTVETYFLEDDPDESHTVHLKPPK